MSAEAGGALAELAALASGAGRADLAAEAGTIRLASPRSLALVAAGGADASRLAAWIVRNVPDLAVRVAEEAVPMDGLGKVALVLSAGTLVDAAIQDRFAGLAALAPESGMAVVVVGAGTSDAERLGRGLGRAFLPELNLAVAELAAHRIFLFEDGTGTPNATLDDAMTAFTAWLRAPLVADEAHRAALGLRLLDGLETPKGEPIPDHDLSADRLRALAARVVRQFESEFETTGTAIEASLGRLEADVEAVLRHGERGSGDRVTPVDVRVDRWESKTHDAVVAMLDRTRGYAEGLLRDVPWDALEARAKAAGLPGDFRRRLLADWREADETPLPHMGESVRKGLGETPTTPQAPMAIQAGVGVFAAAIAFVLMGPVVGITVAVAGVAGVAVGARGSREVADSLTPLFATARAQFAENMAAYIERLRVRTTAILDEAATAAEAPIPEASSDPLLAVRERLIRAAVQIPTPTP